MAAIPDYRLEDCDFILSFACDFLESYVSPVQHAWQFAQMHSYRDGQVGRFVYVGPRLSMTAANADEFLQVRPSAVPAVAVALLGALVERGWAAEQLKGLSLPPLAQAAQAAGMASDKIVALAKAFKDAKASVALAGPTVATGASSVQTAAAAALLNLAAGRIGQTVDFSRPHALGKTATAEQLRQLEDLSGDDVLVVHNANLAYARPDLAEPLRRAGLIVYLGTMPDETAELADWLLPVDSPLEAWGDYEPSEGHQCLVQPALSRLWDSRLSGDVLLGLASAAGRPLSRSGSTGVSPVSGGSTGVSPVSGGSTGVSPVSGGSTGVSPVSGGSTGVSPVSGGSTGVSPVSTAGAAPAPNGVAPPSVLLLGGAAHDFEDWLHQRWDELRQRLAAATPFDEFWRNALRAGGVWERPQPVNVRLGKPAALDLQPPAGSTGVFPAQTQTVELWAWAPIMLFDGRVANRDWLQENPDPTTAVAWGSWLELHPDTAGALGLADNQVVQVTTSAGAIEAPARITGDVAPGVVAASLGQGHTALGAVAAGRGANAFGLLSPAGHDGPIRATLRGTGRRQALICATATQDQHERELMQWAELSGLRALRPGAGAEEVHVVA